MLHSDKANGLEVLIQDGKLRKQTIVLPLTVSFSNFCLLRRNLVLLEICYMVFTGRLAKFLLFSFISSISPESVS